VPVLQHEARNIADHASELTGPCRAGELGETAPDVGLDDRAPDQGPVEVEGRDDVSRVGPGDLGRRLRVHRRRLRRERGEPAQARGDRRAVQVDEVVAPLDAALGVGHVEAEVVLVLR